MNKITFHQLNQRFSVSISVRRELPIISDLRLKNSPTNRIAETVIETQARTTQAREDTSAAGDLLRLARSESEAFEEERRRLDSRRGNLTNGGKSDSKFIKTKIILLRELYEKESVFEDAVNKWTGTRFNK